MPARTGELPLLRDDPGGDPFGQLGTAEKDQRGGQAGVARHDADDVTGAFALVEALHRAVAGVKNGLGGVGGMHVARIDLEHHQQPELTSGRLASQLWR